jgi:hypothetical protein
MRRLLVFTILAPLGLTACGVVGPLPQSTSQLYPRPASSESGNQPLMPMVSPMGDTGIENNVDNNSTETGTGPQV